MSKLAILFVHGIGDNKKDWADRLMRDFSATLEAEVRRLLGPGTDVKAADIVDLRAVYWKDVFHKSQKRLYDILALAAKEGLQIGVHWLTRPFLRYIKAFFHFQHTVVTGYIGDIIGYMGPAARRDVYARITSCLDELAASASGGGAAKRPLTIVAHSLGTVIASDYVYDHARTRGGEGFDARLRLDNLFTVGSPIALFSLRYGGPEEFTSPIRMESGAGRWVNIYDLDDPVGMPLKTLNSAYAGVVAADVHVDAGWYGLSHTAYFNKKGTLKLIARKLAIDWAVLSGRMTREEGAAHYDRYDASLKAPR